QMNSDAILANDSPFWRPIPVRVRLHRGKKRVAPGTVGNSPVEPRLPTHRDHLGDQLLRHSRRRPTIAPPVSAKDSKKRARPSPVKRRFVFLDGSIRASVSLSLNGWRRRLSVSCVGLCLGLIARDTF